MATVVRRWSAGELLALPRGRWRYELVAGELRVYPPTGARHGEVAAVLGARLAMAARTGRAGIVLYAAGFRLASDPDTVRAPDVAFLRADRVPGGTIPPGHLPGAPDLAVEVLAPTDRTLDVEDRVDDYLGAGSRLVWVVNPKHGRVTVHPLDAPARVLGPDDRLDGGEVVPGFACRVRELFA
jgi:Uma2 family endonuclease